MENIQPKPKPKRHAHNRIHPTQQTRHMHATNTHTHTHTHTDTSFAFVHIAVEKKHKKKHNIATDPAMRERKRERGGDNLSIGYRLSHMNIGYVFAWMGQDGMDVVFIFVFRSCLFAVNACPESIQRVTSVHMRIIHPSILLPLTLILILILLETHPFFFECVCVCFCCNDGLGNKKGRAKCLLWSHGYPP